jgi:hypothetical protein
VSTADEVRACLAALRPVYDRVQELRREWQALQTTEQARAAYEERVADLTGRLTALARRRAELAAEWERRCRPEEAEEAPDIDTEFVLPPQPAGRRWRPPSASAPAADTAADKAQQARKRLLDLANRYRHQWHLPGAVLGEVNLILDNPARPLGEALALLAWEVYENRTSAREKTDEDHLVRLREWGEALREYQARLGNKVNTFQNDHHGLLGIWELWTVRTRGPEDEARWEGFIARTREGLEAEIARARSAVADLERRLASGGEP